MQREKVKSVLESAYSGKNFPLGEVRQYEVGVVPDEVANLPFYRYVPKDPVEQLRWRYYVRTRAAEDRTFRLAVIQACEEDILFICNTLGWVHEPRVRQKTLPMNTWSQQDGPLVWYENCYGRRDCLTEKSRDESATWDHCIVFYKHWYFDADSVAGLVSLNEDKADSNDPMSLGWKIRFWHQHMPEWWRYADGKQDCLVYTKGSFYNPVKNSAMFAYACTGNIVRGGRMPAILMDEFGEWLPNMQQRALDSTQLACASRFWPSTFSSDSDRFYQMARVDHRRSPILKVVRDWKDHAEKRKGLYTSVAGNLVILDEEYKFPEDYPFILDGRVRSPYFDYEWHRSGPNEKAIARELERDPSGTVEKIFPDSVLSIARQSAEEPLHLGNLEYLEGDWNPRWTPHKAGKMRIWRALADANEPELARLSHGGPFALGIDIATGASDASSYSAIEVFEIPTGEQILEFYDHRIEARHLARLAYVLCRWLSLSMRQAPNWAYLNFEKGGIGGLFANELVRLNWPHIYTYKGDDTKLLKTSDKSTIGYPNTDGGQTCLSLLRDSIQSRKVVLRSDVLIGELSQYEWGKNARPEYAGARQSLSGASGGRAHGDVAMAAAIAWIAGDEVSAARPQEPIDADPYRQLLLEDERRRKESQRQVPVEDEWIDWSDT